MTYEAGEEIIVEPEYYGDEGDAIASKGGQTVIVKGGVPGETYTLDIVHVNGGVIFTEVVPDAPQRKDIVVDGDGEYEEEYVVINRCNMQIMDWELEDDKTVADYHPNYDPRMKNINVVLKSVLDEELEDWREIPPNELYPEIKRNDISWVNFPEHRLEKTGSARKDSDYTEK